MSACGNMHVAKPTGLETLSQGAQEWPRVVISQTQTTRLNHYLSAVERSAENRLAEAKPGPQQRILRFRPQQGSFVQSDQSHETYVLFSVGAIRCKVETY